MKTIQVIFLCNFKLFCDSNFTFLYIQKNIFQKFMKTIHKKLRTKNIAFKTN